MEAADVVIVGGGPAGLSVALSLLARDPARRGRVVLLEKARYPREKFCAGGLGERGFKILRRLGVEPEVPQVLIAGISVCSREGHHVARPGLVGRVVRRQEFDADLARIARSRGLRIEEGVSLRGVVEDPEGCTLDTSAGELRARLVVGADGVGSAVRRSMGLHGGGLRAFVVEVDTPLTERDLPTDFIHFDASDRRYAGYLWDFPTPIGGEVRMCRGIYALRGPNIPDPDGLDLVGLLGEYLSTKGLHIEDCRLKRFGERGYERRGVVVEGRRMLVGEAAGIDPITGEGIAQAIEAGVRAGRLLSEGPPEVGLAAQWDRRLKVGRLGWDLGVRSELVPLFYGPQRPRLERAFAAAPRMLEAGARHWGALPQRWGQVGLGLMEGLAGFVGLKGLVGGKPPQIGGRSPTEGGPEAPGPGASR